MRSRRDPPTSRARWARRRTHSRHGGQHQVERILRLAAVSRRVRQRADGLEELHDRARPPVRHDERQGVLVARLHVDEVDVEPVDLGLELGERVQLRLDPAPVVVVGPVRRERLCGRELHPLRAVGDELLAGEARRRDAAAEVGQVLFGKVDLEGADGGIGHGGHGALHCPSLGRFTGWATAVHPYDQHTPVVQGALRQNYRFSPPRVDVSIQRGPRNLQVLADFRN
jgi:hypothetical protein